MTEAIPHQEDGTGFWRDHARVILTPTAPPSILGLFGFAAATFIVAGYEAGWYGDADTVFYLVPFALFFGGLAQLAAGLFAYRARDALATAMHGTWGSFWLGYGLLYILIAAGTFPQVTGDEFPALGFWFITLAAITWSGTVAALADNLGLAAVLFFLGLGSLLFAIGEIGGFEQVVNGGAWSFVVSAVLAWYTATAMMLQATFGRVVLPLFKMSKKANIPGAVVERPLAYGQGMPGAKVGQ